MKKTIGRIIAALFVLPTFIITVLLAWPFFLSFFGFFWLFDENSEGAVYGVFCGAILVLVYWITVGFIIG